MTRESDIYHDSNGDPHRDDGPAITHYHPNGKPNRVEYWRHGDLHNLFGPAVIWYNLEGEVSEEAWWYNDEQAPEVRGRRTSHPFFIFCAEHNLPEDHTQWPEDLLALYLLTYEI